MVYGRCISETAATSGSRGTRFEGIEVVDGTLEGDYVASLRVAAR